MKRSRLLLATVFIAASMLVGVSRVSASSLQYLGPIALQKVQLYTHLTCTGQPDSPVASSATFPSTTLAIYALANYSNWQGRHDVQFNWISPDGKSYLTTDDNSADSGPTYDYDYLPVAFDQAATLTGQWTLQIIVDKTPAKSVQFTITAATPTSTAPRADFCIQSVRPEAKGAKADWNLVHAPVRSVKAGQKLRLSMYYEFRNLSPGATIKTVIKVTRAGKTVYTSTAGCKTSCRANFLDGNRTYGDYTPRKTGTYKLSGTLTAAGISQHQSATFKVTKRK